MHKLNFIRALLKNLFVLSTLNSSSISDSQYNTISKRSQRFYQTNELELGFIDVGDGCWRRNMLITKITY